MQHFLEHFPKKTTDNLKIEFELMDFSSKAATRLIVVVEKTLDMCMDFYKRMLIKHNICQTSAEKESNIFLTERDI